MMSTERPEVAQKETAKSKDAKVKAKELARNGQLSGFDQQPGQPAPDPPSD